MYDIDELERRWVRYHRKRLLKRVGWGALLLLLVAGPILYVSLKPSLKEKSREDKRPVTTSEPGGSAMEEKKTLSPIAPIPQRKVSESTPAVSSTERQGALRAVADPEIPSKSKKPKMVITLTDRNAPPAPAKESREEKKIRMKMVDTKNTQVVKEIEARFPDTRDYDDAMYLAKYYYRKKRYRKAEYWAMQANAIDSTQEGSWIIFGKAKAKQGHRTDALRVLQAFYDRSGSMRVKMLIDRIRKGRSY
jgi:hypothetical protein